MQKIIPHLWFDKNAEEAVRFYASVFGDVEVGATTRYTEAGFETHNMPAGTVLTIEFSIGGYDFIALNGGPVFKLNPSISFFLNFDPSKDKDAAKKLDALWQKLSEGGKALMPLDKYFFSERYGWIQDRFGVSWQLTLTNPAGDERPFIVPSLLFTGEASGKAEEAMKHYVSVFEGSKVGQVALYPEDTGVQKKGDLMFGDFMIEGQWFAAMDGGDVHGFGFNEAVSLLVACEDQNEIDRFWEKLNGDPSEGQCGWLHDRFGVSWQIAAQGMAQMLNSADRAAADRVMNAMLQMKKIDMAALKSAYQGR
ncbi:MAG: VOC family protein [Candidatus Taylorbacteria bacterium]|nr:VOC family protein [Candidatus Taylorbacteria bacterium]